MTILNHGICGVKETSQLKEKLKVMDTKRVAARETFLLGFFIDLIQTVAWRV